MHKRIQELASRTLSGEMYVQPIKPEFDRMDIFLPEQENNVKQIVKYIQTQEPLLTKYSSLTGFFNFEYDIVGDIFKRRGHKNTSVLTRHFYTKPINHGRTAWYSRLQTGFIHRNARNYPTDPKIHRYSYRFGKAPIS